MHKVCETFQKSFRPSRPSRRFCSKACKGIWQSQANKRLPDKHCETCGTIFRPHSVTSRFCSATCSGKAQSLLLGPAHPSWKNPDIPCPICGVVFHQAHKRRKHCSRACADSARRGQERPRSLQPRACATCGSIFRPRSHLSKYCQSACGHLSHTKHLQEHNPHERRADRLCNLCQQRFHPRKVTSRYCSKDCANKAKKGRKRNRPPYDEALRKRILARDGGCQDCGATQHLHVHHLNGNPYENDAENLLTLCKACHARRHEAQGEHRTATLILHGRPQGRKRSAPRYASCKHCHSPFLQRLKRQQYCSIVCARKSPRHAPKQYVQVICAYCAQERLYPKALRRRLDHPYYCNRSCYKRAYWAAKKAAL